MMYIHVALDMKPKVPCTCSWRGGDYYYI